MAYLTTEKKESLDISDLLIVAADHLAKGHSVASAIGRLIGVDWQIVVKVRCSWSWNWRQDPLASKKKTMKRIAIS